MSYGVDARELYEALAWYDGVEPYEKILVPWLYRVQDGYRAWLATAAEDGPWWTEKEAEPDGQELVWELYALHGVSDQLLLTFQPRSDEPGSPDPRPLLSEREYLEVFTVLGMTPFEDGDAFDPFDPFLREIVEVEQADDPYTPIEITEVFWPGLMLGQLLFNRAGVRIRASVEQAQRGVADRSPLYWTFRRRHRPAVDLSQGWGGNSQWRTDFRLDYWTPAGDRLNVAGTARSTALPTCTPTTRRSQPRGEAPVARRPARAVVPPLPPARARGRGRTGRIARLGAGSDAIRLAASGLRGLTSGR